MDRLGPTPSSSTGTVRIQYPDLSGSILIIEDQDVDPLVNLLNRIRDVKGTAMRAESFYVDQTRGMGNLVTILGMIETNDVRLVLSDHNLELVGPDGQPIMGALFLRQLADVLGQRRPGEAIQLAAYTGLSDTLLRDYGRTMEGITIIEKGGAHDVVTYCASTLATINQFRRLYSHLTVMPATAQSPLQEELPNHTLAALVNEAAEDVRGNAGVTTPLGMQRIGARIGTSYEGEAVVRWAYLIGGERMDKEKNGSLAKVLSSLVTFCEHSSRVKPVYLLDMRAGDQESEFDLPALTSERTRMEASTALKVTLRVDQQFDKAQEYVESIVRLMFARSFPEGKLYAERGQRGSYVLQLFIPNAIVG